MYAKIVLETLMPWLYRSASSDLFPPVEGRFDPDAAILTGNGMVGSTTPKGELIPYKLIIPFSSDFILCDHALLMAWFERLSLEGFEIYLCLTSGGGDHEFKRVLARTQRSKSGVDQEKLAVVSDFKRLAQFDVRNDPEILAKENQLARDEYKVLNRDTLESFTNVFKANAPMWGAVMMEEASFQLYTYNVGKLFKQYKIQNKLQYVIAIINTIPTEYLDEWAKTNYWLSEENFNIVLSLISDPVKKKKFTDLLSPEKFELYIESLDSYELLSLSHQLSSGTLNFDDACCARMIKVIYSKIEKNEIDIKRAFNFILHDYPKYLTKDLLEQHLKLVIKVGRANLSFDVYSGFNTPEIYTLLCLERSLLERDDPAFKGYPTAVWSSIFALKHSNAPQVWALYERDRARSPAEFAKFEKTEIGVQLYPRMYTIKSAEEYASFFDNHSHDLIKHCDKGGLLARLLHFGLLDRAKLLCQALSIEDYEALVSPSYARRNAAIPEMMAPYALMIIFLLDYAKKWGVIELPILKKYHELANILEPLGLYNSPVARIQSSIVTYLSPVASDDEKMMRDASNCIPLSPDFMSSNSEALTVLSIDINKPIDGDIVERYPNVTAIDIFSSQVISERAIQNTIACLDILKRHYSQNVRVNCFGMLFDTIQQTLWGKDNEDFLLTIGRIPEWLDYIPIQVNEILAKHSSPKSIESSEKSAEIQSAQMLGKGQNLTTSSAAAGSSAAAAADDGEDWDYSDDDSCDGFSYIATNAKNETYYSDLEHDADSGVKFTMKPVCVSLDNLAYSHRLRCGRKSFEVTDENIRTFLQPVNISTLSPVEDRIKQFSDHKQNAVDKYYRMFEVIDLGNGYCRLLSVSPDETIYFDGVDNTVPVFSGEDGYSYVRKNDISSKTFSYVVRASVETIEPIEIDVLLDRLPVSAKKKQTIAQLYQAIKSDAGSCEQRCIHFIIVFSECLPEFAAKLSMVNIDCDHVRVEFRDDLGEILTLDLGGVSAKDQYLISDVAKAMLAKTATEKMLKSQQKTTPADAPALMVEPAIPVMHRTFGEILSEERTKPILLHGDDPRHIGLALLRELHPRPTYLLDQVAKLPQHRETTLLEADGRPTVSSMSEIENFFNEAQRTPGETFICIINWDNFTPAKRLQLNSILDPKHRSMAGITVPDNVRFISLCQKMPLEPSFNDRHDVVDIRYATFRKAKKTKDSSPDVVREVPVDLEGVPDWRGTLFGRIELIDGKLVWNRSEFVRILQACESPLNIQLLNAPPEAKEELSSMVQVANIKGFITYKNLKIPLASHVAIHVSSSAFDFSQFPSVAVTKDVKLSYNSLANAEIINTYIFDKLLYQSEIRDSAYYCEPGLIERARGGELRLYISSSLSPTQMYCLMNQAKKFDVRLHLSIAPGVNLPEIKKHDVPLPVERVAAAASTGTMPRVYITNQTETTEKSLASTMGECVVIPVEDFLYGDLCFYIDNHYDRSTQTFSRFEKIFSDVIHQLSQGKNIILKGVFSNYLWMSLQPLLITPEKFFREKLGLEYTGRLIFVIDEASRLDVRCLEESTVVKVSEPEKTVMSPLIAASPRETLLMMPADLTDSKRRSDEFIAERKSSVLTAIQSHRIFQLTGKTGVGKSSLMRELGAEGGFKLYHELDSLPEWAANQSGLSVLFLDESNIENKHFTFLSPMLDSDRPRILFRGKIYELGPHHRVVFAKNPEEYAGGRTKQRLFERAIPEIELKDFPDVYIYEAILKPIFEASHLAAKGICERTFRYDCENYLSLYRFSAKESLTVRQLQQWVLSYCEKNVRHRYTRRFLNTALKYAPSSSARIEVPSSLRAQLQTRDFFNIRALQTTNRLPFQLSQANSPQALGLNAIILEGPPGMGKSELVSGAFENFGYGTTPADFDLAPGKHKQFYKLDAAIPFEIKKRVLIQAFENGIPVWLDEINACVDDGLEKVLNALLTGVHPDTQKPATKPGFFMVLTANSMGLEGRSRLSPAIEARCVNVSVPCFNKDDIAAIVDKKLLDLQRGERRDLVEQLTDLATNGDLSWRTFDKYWDQLTESLYEHPGLAAGPAA